jgi:hypothetical protein
MQIGHKQQQSIRIYEMADEPAVNGRIRPALAMDWQLLQEVLGVPYVFRDRDICRHICSANEAVKSLLAHAVQMRDFARAENDRQHPLGRIEIQLGN